MGRLFFGKQRLQLSDVRGLRYSEFPSGWFRVQGLDASRV